MQRPPKRQFVGEAPIVLSARHLRQLRRLRTRVWTLLTLHDSMNTRVPQLLLNKSLAYTTLLQGEAFVDKIGVRPVCRLRAFSSTATVARR